MKIFEFKWKDNIDWVYAHDIDDAKEFYLGFTQCFDLDGCVFKELLKEDWHKHNILDIDSFDDDGEYKVLQTFKEYAEENSMTDMIATTAF